MQKNKLLLIPFVVGLILLIYSWFLSYPLSVNSATDTVYNHVSIFYWISIPLLLTSMLLMGLTVKSPLLKWIFSIGIVLVIYSLFYFYAMLPTSDSQYFRGLTEYFIRTKNLDPSLPSHSYYQWPSFFILADITTQISGLALPNFEIVLFTIITMLTATAMYLYASKKYRNYGFLICIAFFFSMFYFFNFQAVPFSLGFALLLLLFFLESQPTTLGLSIVIIILFTSLLFIHAFIPLFFILYFLIQAIISKSGRYAKFFIFSLATYLIVQFSLANVSFVQNIYSVFTKPGEYSQVIAATFVPIQGQLDLTAQMFSRIVTVVSLALCITGFFLMLIKKELRSLDKAVILTGIFYSAVGLFLYTLGTRAIPIAFIPAALGLVYLFSKAKFRKILIGVLLVLSILFVFIPIHQSFGVDMQFQTNENYITENFFISHNDWGTTNLVMADYRVATYIEAKVGIEESHFAFHSYEINKTGSVLLTEAMAKDFTASNNTLEETFPGQALNRVYDSGYSQIIVIQRG